MAKINLHQIRRKARKNIVLGLSVSLALFGALAEDEHFMRRSQSHPVKRACFSPNADEKQSKRASSNKSEVGGAADVNSNQTGAARHCEMRKRPRRRRKGAGREGKGAPI